MFSLSTVSQCDQKLLKSQRFVGDLIPIRSPSNSLKLNHHLFHRKTTRIHGLCSCLSRSIHSTKAELHTHRLVFHEESEMFPPASIPSSFSLSRAVSAINLLQNLDKYGRPLGVVVPDPSRREIQSMSFVEHLPSDKLSTIIGSELVGLPSFKQKNLSKKIPDSELANYPIPSARIPAQFQNHSWKAWYDHLDHSLSLRAKNLPSREAYLSYMKYAYTQSVQHFPSIMCGTVPLNRTRGLAETSWLRVGSGYFDVSNLTDNGINDLMSHKRTDSPEEFSQICEVKSRQYPADDFKWIHFSPEDPRIFYMHMPPPLANIQEQIKEHLVLSSDFTLVPHQFEVYRDDVESLPRNDPIDPNYLGTLIIAFPTECKGGAFNFENKNHSQIMSTEIMDQDLSSVDSDLARVVSDLSKSDPNINEYLKHGQSASDGELSRLDTDADTSLYSEQELESPTIPHITQSAIASAQNWSSFTWNPFGGEGTQGPTGSQRIHNDISWIATTGNVPYYLEKIQSGSRVILTYYIMAKNNIHPREEQAVNAEMSESEAEMQMQSSIDKELVNILFSPKIRQAGISKLMALVSYYFNHVTKNNWLSSENDDITSIGFALRHCYPPDLEAKRLIGVDAWLHQIFSWACKPDSGVFDHQVRTILVPIAMVNQGILGAEPGHDYKIKTEPSCHHKPATKRHSRIIEQHEPTGEDRWHSHGLIAPSNLVYFLDLDGWEHDGPSLSHDAYAACARHASLPTRTLSQLEREIYGDGKTSYNPETQWNSVPFLYGQRWGDQFETWEPSPVLDPENPNSHHFKVIGRKTFTTTALILQKVENDSQKL